MEVRVKRLDIQVGLRRLDDEDKAALAAVMSKWGGMAWWNCGLLIGEPGESAAECETVPTPFFLVKYRRAGFRLFKVSDELAHGTRAQCMEVFVKINKPHILKVAQRAFKDQAIVRIAGEVDGGDTFH